MRITNVITYKFGVFWPCSFIIFSFLLLVSSLIDGLDSDFGTLGVPWCKSKSGRTVEWTTKDLLKGLEEFVPIYETHPIKNNQYGMGFDHKWCFKGHSTWVLRRSNADTPILSLTPRHPEKYLKKGPAYVDGNCTYFAGKDFVDFGNVDWKSVMKKHGVTDLSRVLIFFDDHQNELKRIFTIGTGDHYSLRQICDQSYIERARTHFDQLVEILYLDFNFKYKLFQNKNQIRGMHFIEMYSRNSQS
ncbi:hypothetical protein MKW92_030548 [Papaver armeniacum]|nr:hypothetical protein MKW92_030548 [Papaver armeniacum]